MGNRADATQAENSSIHPFVRIRRVSNLSFIVGSAWHTSLRPTPRGVAMQRKGQTDEISVSIKNRARVAQAENSSIHPFVRVRPAKKKKKSPPPLKRGLFPDVPHGTDS
jgi:hypothetical protein